MAPQPKPTGPGVRVYLESGRSSVFAVALDWPGWCRRAKTPDAALEALDSYRNRYVASVGRSPLHGEFEVIGTVEGNRTTDFGAPDARGPWDDDPPTGGELVRQIGLLGSAWTYFDGVVATAPEAMRKGPRGGGRDRDAIVAHVMEAERAYGRKVGARVPPRTPWADQRAALAAALESGGAEGAWPVGYALRRLAWHVLDHAWEIEDKSD
jgi:hypothetical protein